MWKKLENFACFILFLNWLIWIVKLWNALYIFILVTVWWKFKFNTWINSPIIQDKSTLPVGKFWLVGWVGGLQYYASSNGSFFNANPNPNLTLTTTIKIQYPLCYSSHSRNMWLILVRVRHHRAIKCLAMLVMLFGLFKILEPNFFSYTISYFQIIIDMVNSDRQRHSDIMRQEAEVVS